MRTPIRWITLAGAVLVAGCGSGSGAGPATELAVVSPAGNATGVSVGTTITMTFTGPMMAGMEQFVDLHQGDMTGPVMPMTCVWSPDQTTLTCTPASPLAAGTHYMIHAGAGMHDADGHRVLMDPGMTMGGDWVMQGMMGGMHDGMPIGMMGSGWRDGMGHYGMMFEFETS